MSAAATPVNNTSRRTSISSSADGLFSRWLDMPLSLGEGFSERDLLVSKMSQWLIQHDRVYYASHNVDDINDAIGEILDIITNLVGMLKSSSQMLAVVMLYADKFVKRSGIKHNQLFNLLLTSTVITVKFWNESVVVSNKNIAQVFEFSLEDVNLMERRFLAGVEYQLVLSEDDVKSFLMTILNDYYTADTTMTEVNTPLAAIKAQPTAVVSPATSRKCAPVTASAASADITSFTRVQVAAAAQ